MTENERLLNAVANAVRSTLNDGGLHHWPLRAYKSEAEHNRREYPSIAVDHDHRRVVVVGMKRKTVVVVPSDVEVIVKDDR